MYNGLVTQWQRLDALMTELRGMFPENNPQKKLEDTFRHLNRITGEHRRVVCVCVCVCVMIIFMHVTCSVSIAGNSV